MSLNYQDDSEDIDFPPVKFSPDLIYEEPNKNQKNCLNKFFRIFKNKRNLILLIIGISIVIVIIAIILIVTLKSKPKEKNIEEYNENYNNNIITVELGKINSDEKVLTIFNTDKININSDDFSMNIKDEKLRILLDDNKGKITENKLELNGEINENLILEIKFKKELSSMEEMFKNNAYLINADLSLFNSSKIINLNSAFLNCVQLKNINFTDFDSQNLISMDSTFENCNSLEQLDLSYFISTNLSSMKKTFKNCYHLEKLNLSNIRFNENLILDETFDSINKNISIIINNNSYDKFKNEIKKNNITIINQINNCQMNIEHCVMCKTFDKCERCETNFSLSGENGICTSNSEENNMDKSTRISTSTIENNISPAANTTLTDIPSNKNIISTNIQNNFSTNITNTISTNIQTSIPPNNSIAITNYNISPRTSIPTTIFTSIPTTTPSAIFTSIPTTTPSTIFTSIPTTNQTTIFTSIPTTNPNTILLLFQP